MTATTPGSYALTILGALQKRAMYAGTVPVKTVRRRRAENRVARKSRRLNRAR